MRKLGKFDVLKRKNKYKSIDQYLDAVYRKNKQLIDEKVLNDEDLALASNRDKLLKTSKRTAFKNWVKEYMDEGYSVDQALKKVSNTRVFTDYTELAQNNLMDALKADKEAYKEFRELTKEKGKYTKIDSTRFTYLGHNEYSYGNIVVSFKNSPKEIIVRKI